MKPGKFLRIENPKGGTLVIHESDYDPAVHKLAKGEGEATSKAKPKPRTRAKKS